MSLLVATFHHCFRFLSASRPLYFITLPPTKGTVDPRPDLYSACPFHTIPGQSLHLKMLVQSFWLSSLLCMVSATAHATSLTNIHPPADLKRRYLSTGTGVSLPSIATPPYPTGSANATAVPTGSTYPTSSLLPSSASSSATTPTATAVPPPTIGPYYLVVAHTGTPFDGDYINLDFEPSDEGLNVLVFGSTELVPGGDSVYYLFSDGTFQNDNTGWTASYVNSSASFVFPNPGSPDYNGETAVTCEYNVGGVLTCQKGVFYAFPQTVVGGDPLPRTPFVQLGSTVPIGAYQLTLLLDIA